MHLPKKAVIPMYLSCLCLGGPVTLYTDGHASNKARSVVPGLAEIMSESVVTDLSSVSARLKSKLKRACD